MLYILSGAKFKNFLRIYLNQKMMCDVWDAVPEYYIVTYSLLFNGLQKN